MVYAIDISDPNVNPIARFAQVSVFLNIVIPLITTLAGVVFVIMLLVGAFTMITAGGDPERFRKAQKTLKFAVIGIFFVILAYIIVKALQYLLGIGPIF